MELKDKTDSEQRPTIGERPERWAVPQVVGRRVDMSLENKEAIRGQPELPRVSRTVS